MKQSEVQQLLTFVLADHGISPTAEKTSVWFEVVKHIEFPLAMKAAKVLVSSKTYGIPKVSDFLKVVDELTKPDNDRLTGEEAWRMALGIAAKYGAERGPEASASIADYPRVVHAIRTTGYRLICHTDDTQLPFLRKTFLELYDKVIERDEIDKKITGHIGAPPQLAVITADLVKKLGV